MIITFAEYQIELGEWNNKQDMVNYLKNCFNDYILLGENPDQENEFYSLAILSGNSEGKKLGIGVCSQGHGLTPNVLFLPQEMRIILGFNFNVALIDIKRKEILSDVQLDSLFYKFLHIYELDLVIAIHEIGVIAFSESGDFKWKLNRDIITGSIITKNGLLLEFMDSPLVLLNLRDGKPLDLENARPSGTVSN